MPSRSLNSSLNKAKGARQDEFYTQLPDIEAELFRTGENELSELEGDGDFRSAECEALLDEADIVVTNPPFSLFREYVAQLVEHGKHFVIVGLQNAIKYKEVFPLIQGNRLWLGYGFTRGDAYFSIPPENARDFSAGVYDPEKGLVHFRNCTWFTNLDIKKRHEELILVKRYSPEAYQKYGSSVFRVGADLA